MLGIHSLSKIGSARLFALMDYFGDYEAAWDNIDLWPDALGQSFDLRELKREWCAVDLTELYEKFLRSRSKLVTVSDPEYPERLRYIPDPPYALFYRGELPPDDAMAVAIVGSRKATAYGREAAAYFANGLAQNGAWVIGGMARGIDSAAHRAAMDAAGHTVGVLGCGIDVVYPPENAALYDEAQEKGCIISEYPLGMQPMGRNFPIRNRIISGLSDAVLVVEAGAKSGTQITVNCAAAQGRHIYAVPGSIFSPASAGTIALIHQGRAAIAGSAADILSDLRRDRLSDGERNLPRGKAQNSAGAVAKPKETGRKVASAPPLMADKAEQMSFAASLPKAPPLPEGKMERRLVEFVTEQKHFNDIARELELPAPELATMLTMMEIGGFIKRADGQYYIRSQT